MAEAHARLIAAAPEMLDMLETIENDGNQVPAWLWKKIQDVIKKAGGRTKPTERQSDAQNDMPG